MRFERSLSFVVKSSATSKNPRLAPASASTAASGSLPSAFSKPGGALATTTRDPGLIPSFCASGVFE